MSRSRSRSRSQEDRGKRDDRSRRRDKDADHHRSRSTRSRSRSRDDERRSKDDRKHHRRDSRDRDHHHRDRDRDRDRDSRGKDRDRERDRDRDRENEKQPIRQGFTPLGTEDIATTERSRGTTLPAWMDVEGKKGGDISSSSSSSNPQKDDRHTNTSTGTTATSTLMEMRSLAWGNQAKEEELTHPTVPIIAEEDQIKADFGLSGALAKDKNTGNMYNGVVLKWTEPLDSARPTKKWRLYVFKSGEVVETLHLHRQSAYLFGRDTRIADVILQHESCSKQHAVLQVDSQQSIVIFISFNRNESQLIQSLYLMLTTASSQVTP